jgi:diguanylate cyclase (GGDEF)-like protein
MEIKAYLRILKRRWWVLVLCLVLTLAATIGFSQSRPDMYETATTYIIRPRLDSDTKDEFVKTLDMVSSNSEIGTTFSEVANSKLIKQSALKKLALSPEQQENLSVQARVIGGTNILELNVQGRDPSVVRDFANAVGVEFVSYISQLYDVFDLELLDEAALPTSAVKTNTALTLIIGVFLGLVLGTSLVFLFEYLQAPDDTMSSFNIIDRETGAYNKSFFMLRLWQEMSRAKRNKYPLSLSLIKIEIDEGADSASPTEADRIEAMRVVKVFADQSLRDEDILARFDHDVYAVLLPDLQVEKARAIIESLLSRIGSVTLDAIEKDGALKIIGIAGVVSNVSTRNQQEQFLKQALSALESSDREAGGKVILFSEKPSIDTYN